MKLRLLFSLLVLSFFLVANSGVEGLREIDLRGELDPTGSRSIVLPSVTAEQSDNAVIVTFTKAVGAIDIVVRSESEVVYSMSLNVAVATRFSIYTGGFADGAYVLEVTKPATTGRVYGEFIVE